MTPLATGLAMYSGDDGGKMWPFTGNASSTAPPRLPGAG